MLKRLLPTEIPGDVFSQHSIQDEGYSKKSSKAENKVDSEGRKLIQLDLIEKSDHDDAMRMSSGDGPTSTLDYDSKALGKRHVFWPGNQLVTRLKISKKGWQEIEEIHWELKGEVNTVKQRDDPMTQSSGGKVRRTIFKSVKTLKKSSVSEEPDLEMIKASKNGLSFPISTNLRDGSSSGAEKDMVFLISSILPDSLPRASAAARGRTLSQRPSLPPTFSNSDRYSVVYCVKVWFRLKSNKSRTRLRIWKPFIVLPFSAFPTPDLELPPLTANQPPPNWKVCRKTSHFGRFSSRRTITSSFAFPSPRYVSSKDWIPFFLYVEVKSPVKAALATSRLPVLPRREPEAVSHSNPNNKKGKDQRKSLLEPQIVLSRQDDSPATNLGKSFADPKRVPCEIEWISGFTNQDENGSQENQDRGRNDNRNVHDDPSHQNSRRQSQDVGIGYSWTDIVKTSSEQVTLNNLLPNDNRNGSTSTSTSTSFEGGEELLPRFSQLSFRSRSSSRRRGDSLPGGRGNGRNLNKEDNNHETWYRSALLFGRLRTRALTPGFGLPSLSVQYNWRLSWNVNPDPGPDQQAAKLGSRAGKILQDLFTTQREILTMSLGLWLPSTGITSEQFQAGLSREEVDKRIGIES